MHRCLVVVSVLFAAEVSFAANGNDILVWNGPGGKRFPVLSATNSLVAKVDHGPEIGQMPGFPIHLDGVHPADRGVVLADLDGDHDLEIVASFYSGSAGGWVYAWDHSGTTLPGFPVATGCATVFAPTVGDLEGDGDLEIIQTCRFSGAVYAIDHTGNVLPGFPVTLGDSLLGASTLFDLDADSMLEILVGTTQLHVIEMDGSEWGGNWPVTPGVVDGNPTVGDVDADGSPEVFFPSERALHLLETDGTYLPGWPQTIANHHFWQNFGALADLDHDGDLEIVVGAMADRYETPSECHVFHHDGTHMEGWPQIFPTLTLTNSPPTITDLEGDGELEIILGSNASNPPRDPETKQLGWHGELWVWRSNGVVKPGFPYVLFNPGDGYEGPFTVADIDGNGRLEVFSEYACFDQYGSGFVLGMDADGNDLPGFPLRPDGVTFMNGAIIGDVDNDGDYELGVVTLRLDLATLELSGSSVYLYDLTDTYATTPWDWKTHHARNERGGLLVQVSAVIFEDGFESGDMSAWSQVVE